MADVEEPRLQRGAMQQSQSLKQKANPGWNRKSRQCADDHRGDSGVQQRAKLFPKDGLNRDFIPHATDRFFPPSACG
jgi:hypothetical protein